MEGKKKFCIFCWNVYADKSAHSCYGKDLLCQKCGLYSLNQRGFDNHSVECDGSQSKSQPHVTVTVCCKPKAEVTQWRRPKEEVAPWRNDVWRKPNEDVKPLRQRAPLTRKPIVCPYCNTKFTTLTGMRTHMRSHTKPNKSAKCRCKVCGVAISTLRNLERHMQMLHKEQLQSDGRKSPPSILKSVLTRSRSAPAAAEPVVKLEPFDEEDMYDASMDGPQLMVTDVKSLHEDALNMSHENITNGQLLQEESPTRRNLRYKVPHTTTNYKAQNYMNRNSGNKKSRYVCRTCGKQFIKSQYLIVHLRVHTGERPYTCKVCGFRFTQFAHLSTHMKSVHLGMFTCPYCQKRCGSMIRLRRHAEKCMAM